MKKSYFFQKLKPFLFICCFLLVGSINLSAQTVDSIEEVEDKVASIRDQAFKGFREKTGVSDMEFQEFALYYQKVIGGNMGKLFNYLKKHPHIKPLQEQQYVTSMQNGYVTLYVALKKIKAEFPSSVAEAIAIRQPHHATGICNPTAENLNFASGTLAGWTTCYANCSSEDVSCTSPPDFSTPPNFSYDSITCGTSTGVNGAGPDAHTGNDYQVTIQTPGADALVPTINKVCSGYSYSAMIGDGQSVNWGVGRLEQTFTVIPDSTDFYYNYAIFLENPGHCYHQQPYFSFVILDQNGDTIPTCTPAHIVSGSGSTAWGSTGDWQYLNWTPGYVSLKKYVGQCVTVIVMTSDCGQGGHAGYAYFDAGFQNTLNIGSSAKAICSSPITLTAQVPATLYQWSYIGGGTGCITPSAGNTQAISVNCPGTYQVIINPVSGSCVDTFSIILPSDNQSISIVSSPTNDSVCPGSSITLSGSGGSGFTWSGGITNGVAFSPSSSGEYVVSGIDTSGCSGKDSVWVVAGTGALPTITATSSPTSDTICKGSYITLSGSGASYYNWSGGVTNGLAFAPSSSGKYIVTGTSSNGCSNTDTVNITVNQPPAIIISGKTPILAGTPDTLTASGASTYLWSTGSTNDTTIVAPAIATTYTVTSTGANGCSDTASFIVTITTITGVSNINLVNGVALYPNPANEFLNLNFNTNGKVMSAIIKIADISGKQWMEQNTTITGNKIVPVNISSLANGMYFISIETNYLGTKTLKFIKE